MKSALTKKIEQTKRSHDSDDAQRRGFGTLVYRIKRLKMEHLAGLKSLWVLDSTDHRKVDRVLIFGTGRKRTVGDDLVGCDSFQHEGSPRVSFSWSVHRSYPSKGCSFVSSMPFHLQRPRRGVLLYGAVRACDD
jgi:hypothetical protein